MFDPHRSPPLPITPVVVHAAGPLDDPKVLVFISANAHVSHVTALSVQAARDLVVALLNAIDIASLDEGSQER